MSIIDVQGVSYTYNTKYHKVHALKSVSYKFDEGKIYAIVGKSGSGKSTLLSLLAGLEAPDTGDIFYKGASTKSMNLVVYRRKMAAMIYQDFKLFPLLTVAENIMFPMELCGMKTKKAYGEAKKLIGKVALPENLFHRYPAMISGGEQQRVAIARALSMDRKLIIADEPTGNLDSENGDNIIRILTQLAHKDNYCVIIATHDLSITDKVDGSIRIKDGKIMESKDEAYV